MKQPSLDVVWGKWFNVYGSSDHKSLNNLHINTSKMKEMVVDFQRNPPPITLVNIYGLDIQVADTYKFLGFPLNDKQDW